MPAHTVPILAALTTLTVTAVLVFAAYRMHRLRRALDAERAARRLASHRHADDMRAAVGMHARDMDAFHDRIRGLLQDRAVLAEAEQILDTALAHHRPEGGNP